MNKIGKPNADREKVRQQLAEVSWMPDDWDGDTMVVPISAKKQIIRIEDLLEGILLIADNMISKQT
jgi:translation initiation factor IF-2